MLEKFRRHLTALRLDGRSALVAVSGGADSVALLDLLVRTRDLHALDLVVVHVDHGIHPESRVVADRVRALAVRYGLPFELGCLRLGAAVGETVARAERYAWLEATRRRVGADFVFVAHHADDQVETVLMRTLRGSGPAGLAGMAARQGILVRPLLPFRRSALVEYVRLAGLPVWFDPANEDPRHLRSWLRTEILPVLRARLPDVDRALRRVAAQAAQDRAAWDAVLDRLPGLALRPEDDGVSLALEPLVPGPLSAAILKAAARRIGCRLGPARLTGVEALIRSGESGASVPLGGSWRAEVSFGRLHFVTDTGACTPPLEPWEVEGDAGEKWWGRWHFRWSRMLAPARHERRAFEAWLVPGRLTVRSWRPGDGIRPVGGRGRRPVTHCFQEVRIPRWRRAVWPVVVVGGAADGQGGDRVVWVPGVCRSDALPQVATPALRLDVEYI